MDFYVMQTDVDSFIIYLFIFRQNDSLTESNIRLDIADDRIFNYYFKTANYQ